MGARLTLWDTKVGAADDRPLILDTDSAIIETARHPDLIGNPRVTMYALSPTPEWIAWGTLPFFINLPAKVIQQFWTLFYILMYAAPPARWIIIQVRPPACA